MANTGIEKISNVWQELCFKQNVGVSAFIQCVFELTHNPSKDLAKERTPGTNGWTLNKSYIRTYMREYVHYPHFNNRHP